MLEAKNGSDLVDKIFSSKAVAHNRNYSANFPEHNTPLVFTTALNKNKELLTEFVFKAPFKPIDLDENLLRDIASIAIKFDLMQEESVNKENYYYDLYETKIKKFLRLIPYHTRGDAVVRIGKDRVSLDLLDYEKSRKLAEDVFDLYLKHRQKS